VGEQRDQRRLPHVGGLATHVRPVMTSSRRSSEVLAASRQDEHGGEGNEAAFEGGAEVLDLPVPVGMFLVGGFARETTAPGRTRRRPRSRCFRWHRFQGHGSRQDVREDFNPRMPRPAAMDRIRCDLVLCSRSFGGHGARASAYQPGSSKRPRWTPFRDPPGRGRRPQAPGAIGIEGAGWRQDRRQPIAGRRRLDLARRACTPLPAARRAREQGDGG